MNDIPNYDQEIERQHEPVVVLPDPPEPEPEMVEIVDRFRLSTGELVERTVNNFPIDHNMNVQFYVIKRI